MIVDALVQYFRAVSNLCLDKGMKQSSLVKAIRQSALDSGIISRACLHSWLWSAKAAAEAEVFEAASFAIGLIEEVCSDFPTIAVDVLTSSVLLSGMSILSGFVVDKSNSPDEFARIVSTDDSFVRDKYGEALVSMWKLMNVSYRLFFVEHKSGWGRVPIGQLTQLWTMFALMTFANKEDQVAGLTIPGAEQLGTGVSQLPVNGAGFFARAALDEDLVALDVWATLVNVAGTGKTLIEDLASLAAAYASSPALEEKSAEAGLMNCLLALAALRGSPNENVANCADRALRSTLVNSVPLRRLPQFAEAEDDLLAESVFFKDSSGFELINGEETTESEDEGVAAPDGRPVSDAAKAAIEAGLCTFSQTGERHAAQYWYVIEIRLTWGQLGRSFRNSRVADVPDF